VSDIFQEVDEDLRRDNFAKLWARYGIYVIILAVVVVVATGATVAWRQYQQSLRVAEGNRFAAALDLVREGKNKEAGDIFSALAKDAPNRRAALARFEEAALVARSGDTARATADYETIAADASLDSSYRDLALLLAAQYGLATADPKVLIERLAPLATGEGPWHPTALELTALAQLKAGDKTAARGSYQKLADDLKAPQGLRTRAAEMATGLAQ
jgi:hypothetical protein